MTQLNLNLGGGTLVRIDPVTPSTGQTTITNAGGGNFQIQSFFDIFTDLSLDGGQTWIPGNGPGPRGSTEVTLTNLPEPAPLALIGTGVLLLLGAAARRRRK